MVLPLLLALTLTSPDIRTGAPIAREFVWNKDGCNGENRTPRLVWDAPPHGTRSLILTVTDHDATKPNGWLHWAVFEIPATARALSAVAPRPAVVLRNDFGTFGWGGPCPPPGQLHHYTFMLRAMGAHDRVLARTIMVPVYRR